MSSSNTAVERNIYTNAKTAYKIHFPEIIDDKINTEEFLQAARDVVWTIGTFLHSVITSICLNNQT